MIAPGFRLPDHVAGAGLQHQERALEIDGDDAIEVGLADSEEITRHGYSGVVHQDIDGAEIGDDTFDQRSDLGRLRNVARDIGGSKRTRRRRTCSIVHVAHHHGGALRQEAFGNG